MNADQEYIWNGVLTMYEGFIEKNRPKIDKFINEDCTVWDSTERDMAFGQLFRYTEILRLLATTSKLFSKMEPRQHAKCETPEFGRSFRLVGR